jgi:hypothetical protein
MTQSEEARLAVVESKVDTLTDTVARIETKLDEAIACKADKTAVETIASTQRDHDRAINRLSGGLALVAVGIPVFLYLIEKAFR